ncbi:MAG TPA: hypothetical protein VI386_16085 [Candidatus Sulfotelmatobacter sp.]
MDEQGAAGAGSSTLPTIGVNANSQGHDLGRRRIVQGWRGRPASEVREGKYFIL